MKITFLPILSLSALLFACDGTQKAPDEITETYYGTLPCADCPGIYYELTLDDDFTYVQKKLYLESDMDTLVAQGNFEVKNDSLIELKSTSGEGGLDHLKFSNGELKILDAEGKENTTEMAEYFTLKITKPLDMSMAENSEDSNKTASFKATGNEPFWSLRLDHEKNVIQFKTMEGTGITTTIPEATETEGKLVYDTDASPGILKVTILEEACQDGMSGEIFTHKVSVVFKTSEMQATSTYTGCGEYATTIKNAEELSGKWMLEKMDDEAITNGKSYKIPTMEINLEEGKAMGNAGCNRYSGGIKFQEANQISFHQVISTKMACEGMDMETKFLGAISGKTLTYAVQEGKLTLSGSDTNLTFKKAD